MPAPAPPQPPVAGQLEGLDGRQIFIDGINESKAALGLAYSPPFVVSDSRQVEEAAFASNDDVSAILDGFNDNSTKPWNASDYDEDGKFWRE